MNSTAPQKIGVAVELAPWTAGEPAAWSLDILEGSIRVTRLGDYQAAAAWAMVWQVAGALPVAKVIVLAPILRPVGLRRLLARLFDHGGPSESTPEWSAKSSPRPAEIEWQHQAGLVEAVSPAGQIIARERAALEADLSVRTIIEGAV